MNGRLGALVDYILVVGCVLGDVIVFLKLVLFIVVMLWWSYWRSGGGDGCCRVAILIVVGLYIVLEGSQDQQVERKPERNRDLVTDETTAKKVAEGKTTEGVYVIKLEIYTVKMALPYVLDT